MNPHWWPKISVWESASTPSGPVPAENVSFLLMLAPVCDPKHAKNAFVTGPRLGAHDAPQASYSRLRMGKTPSTPLTPPPRYRRLLRFDPHSQQCKNKNICKNFQMTNTASFYSNQQN